MSSSKFSFTVSLKQQTPLIHFQHDQDFATIRATEIKPKLDQYIWAKEWKRKFEQGKAFLQGYNVEKSNVLEKKYKEGFNALDYSIQVIPQQAPECWKIDKKYPLYFGNMKSKGEEKEEKHFSFTKGIIEIKIKSFNTSLLDLVKKHIGQFFNTENFGTRQNKGFGAFRAIKVGEGKPKLYKPSKYYFELDRGMIGVENTYDKLFRDIETFYKTLRSGINLKGDKQEDKLYFKSLMFQYAKSENETWDKRKIRRDLFKNNPKFKEIELKRDDPNGTVQFYRGETRLYRDMLGLSSTESWYYYRATVTKSSPNVDRFKSPITFKPTYINKVWRVYIIAGEIPESMKNENFTIKSGRLTSDIATPDFDLDKYLRFAFSFFNENGLTVENYVGDHKAPFEVELLENIYTQLSSQVK